MNRVIFTQKGGYYKSYFVGVYCGCYVSDTVSNGSNLILDEYYKVFILHIIWTCR